MGKWVSLEDALCDSVRSLYDAECQLIKAMPKMAAAVTRAELRDAIRLHIDETRTHVLRLEQVLSMLGSAPPSSRCSGVAGIIEEAAVVLVREAADPVRDASIIAWLQRAEHYEISAYGTAAAWADALEYDSVANLLRETLAEEKDADETLTMLAESDINSLAATRLTEQSGQPYNSAQPDAAA